MSRPIYLPSRRCGKTASTCQGCGMPWNRLFDAFTSGIGWRKLCGRCSDPQPSSAEPAAYRGRYPALTVIDGGAK